jgi:hypothetical protein
MIDDPDIAKAWDDLHLGLERLLRPHVADHTVADLAKRAVAELIAGPGWRPPLHPALDWIKQGRTRRTREALDEGSS